MIDLIKRLIELIRSLFKEEVIKVMIKIENVIIHLTDSHWGDVEVVDSWHKDRGWSGIGYNVVILNGFRTYVDYKGNKYDPTLEGSVELGRKLNRPGAHVKGLNHNSVGVAFVGKGPPSLVIRRAIFNVALYYIIEHKVALENVIGHREAQERQGIPEAARKLCPGYEVSETRAELKQYLETKKLLQSIEA